ncbi:MAG: adenylate kinase family protein [Candidatus Bathyarchaeia archaeon]
MAGKSLPDRKRIIVVTGTPGVGKSSLARALAERLGWIALDLSDFSLKEGLLREYDGARRTWVIDENRLRKAIMRLLRNLKSGIIVEGHYAQAIVPSNGVELALVLRCDPRVLEERLRDRGYGEDKVLENIEAEILDLCLLEALNAFGASRVHEIDMTKLSLEEAIGEALEVILGRKRPSLLGIDWIGILEREGCLERYLVGRRIEPEGKKIFDNSL